ncbi:Hypothetical predicted protein [Mytilus galloprovincialis]|uniref:Uncharacterized protein n=1 Tax=Mytilus galloprovincialis TaxID=29158 RepID=A0A8B6CKB5_MYTGA|nr:Hypothetical predicted protein [Mytilus galloprovincialis]
MVQVYFFYTNRQLLLGDVENKCITSSQNLMIRFTEEEANTSDIARKVREQTSAIEDYILTDGKGNEIYDSEATRDTPESFYQH